MADSNKDIFSDPPHSNSKDIFSKDDPSLEKDLAGPGKTSLKNADQSSSSSEPDIETIKQALNTEKIVEHTAAEDDDVQYKVTTDLQISRKRWKASTIISPELMLPEEIRNIHIDIKMQDYDKFLKQAAQQHVNCFREAERHCKNIKKKEVHVKRRLYIAIAVIAVIALGALISIMIKNGTPPHTPNGKEAKDGKQSTAVRNISKIVEKLETGEFQEAVDKLDHLPSDNTKFRELKNQINKPLDLDIQCELWKQNQNRSASYPCQAPPVNGAVLTHEDNYRINVITPPGKGNIYLYIIQIDDFNKIFMLLPSEKWSGLDTPEIEYDKTYPIPVNDNDWLYLEELSSGALKPFYETIYVIASPWRARDIEKMYNNEMNSVTEENREEFAGEFIHALEQRRDAGVPSVFFSVFSFIHE